MDNENNNADFEATVNEVHPTLRPAPDMTLKEFVDKVKNLADSMLEDFEEHTGESADVAQSWDYWNENLQSAYLNS